MLIVNAQAKINLTLDITGKRPDNYHEVAMVMQAIELSDQIKFSEEAKGTGITLSCNVPGLPCGERNLAYRAAQLFLEQFAIKQGVSLELTKKIPIAAGLAGGSTDAAAVLISLNKLFGTGLAQKDLCQMGAKLGSDVPFCIQGGTKLATGRGEILESLPSMPECHVVLAKPPVKVSTAWAYQNYRAEKVSKHPDTTGIITCLERGDLTGIGRLLCNVLESVTMNRYTEIARIKGLMLKQGAMASLMSGSGPTVFGLTPDPQKAAYIAEKLRALTSAQVILTKTVCGN